MESSTSSQSATASGWSNAAIQAPTNTKDNNNANNNNNNSIIILFLDLKFHITSYAWIYNIKILHKIDTFM